MVVIILVKKFQNGRPWKDSTSSPPKDEIYRDLFFSSNCSDNQQDLGVHLWDPSLYKVEAGVQGYYELHTELQANLNYKRLSLKKRYQKDECICTCP